MRDSFVFYRSWADSIEMLPKTQQIDVYKSIVNYALKGDEPKLSGTANIIFELIKPLLDANNKRYIDGCKGGRPKDEEAPRKELDGIELTNLTEVQYQRLCDRYGENLTNKAIELYEDWLTSGTKTAKQRLGKNHYASFRSDDWTIKEAKKLLENEAQQNQPNWSI